MPSKQAFNITIFPSLNLLPGICYCTVRIVPGGMKCALVNLALLQFVIKFILACACLSFIVTVLFSYEICTSYSVKKSNPKIQAWLRSGTTKNLCLIRRSSICISKIASAVILWTAPPAPRMSWMEGRLTHFGFTPILSKKLWLQADKSAPVSRSAFILDLPIHTGMRFFLI